MLSVLLRAAKTVLPDWPEWALDVLLLMSVLLVAAGGLVLVYSPDEEGGGGEKQSKKSGDSNGTTANGKAETKHELLQKHHAFRRQYMLVYLVIMLADWMQGTHMYTLYLSYGVNISALFLTGFLSGAIFAPFLGSFVDKFGRRSSCIVYCVLEIIINVMEHFDNMPILLTGRVLGGISTNLLFSAFESWMTTEHRRKGFPEEWLEKIYSQCSIVNGSMAIFAGIVAQVLEDYFGHIGPFQGAVALTVLALVLVMGWEENYGEQNSGDSGTSSVMDQFWAGWRTTISDSRVWRIGLTQAMSEGAMYTFVFMWVPTLLSLNPPGGVPTGCVFSALMMAITIGGLAFAPLQALITKVLGSHSCSSEVYASLVYLLASLSMFIPVLCLTSMRSDKNYDSSAEATAYIRDTILLSFLVVEFCIGSFMPVAGTLRSKYVPDALQGAILNIFRLPLNAIVVSGTYATDHLDATVCYKLVSGCFLGAALLQSTMISQAAKPAASTTSKKTD